MTDTRNIVDFYKDLEHEAIVADLETKRNSFITVCQNLTNDINKSSVVRNHNAFNGKELWFYGKKKWYRPGSVGTYKYINIHHAENVDEVFEHLYELGYICYAIENNVSDSVSVYDVRWAKKAAFFFGEENEGLSQEVIDKCDKIVTIPQYGSTRSINIACASAVIMNSYMEQYHE